MMRRKGGKPELLGQIWMMGKARLFFCPLCYINLQQFIDKNRKKVLN